ncbi:hypothetical protein DPMN_146743 [Dreissena polymorpha]|uniref:Uncharacterized protein n=1 Tax=Dreissena polymorpha TaxID=45954 RepID=A0A9D4J2N1_DREPO|nr:hypothetical protein DPMN_146743 [Dreissena polymorpha]
MYDVIANSHDVSQVLVVSDTPDAEKTKKCVCDAIYRMYNVAATYIMYLQGFDVSDTVDAEKTKNSFCEWQSKHHTLNKTDVTILLTRFGYFVCPPIYVCKGLGVTN